VITLPYSVREGINVFLDGFIPTENLRFRQTSLSFKVADTTEEILHGDISRNYRYPDMSKTFDGFKLNVE
jgi:ATP-binding cassette subfamily E protein 1